jgi:hypothetical protein
MTPEELREFSERLNAELAPLYRERLADPAGRPESALPVELLTFAYPMAAPRSER